MKKITAQVPPIWEARLRVVSYLVFAVWPVAFLAFIPIAYTSTLELTTVFVWMGATFIGAGAAALGAILKIDFKLELPGLMLMLVGPGFYMLAQAWYSFFPPIGALDVSARYHLVVLALYLVMVHLPRIAKLQHEKGQAKRIHENHRDLPELTDAQKSQPGAFPELEES